MKVKYSSIPCAFPPQPFFLQWVTRVISQIGWICWSGEFVQPVLMHKNTKLLMKCVGGHFSHESGGKGTTIAGDNEKCCFRRGGAGFSSGYFFHFTEVRSTFKDGEIICRHNGWRLVCGAASILPPSFLKGCRTKTERPPAARMVSSTILQASPEWVIQPAAHWIRPCHPKGLPCRGRKALLPFTETLVCHPAISFT